MLKASPVISKINKQDESPGNYYWLRSLGLQHIQELSGLMWTDYNTHDPGITILEVLCFALTDLDYRTNFPITDLLAAETENETAMHQQFLSAIKALPSRPVSIHDYRKLLVDIPGVKNAWLKKADSELPVYYDHDRKELTTLTTGLVNYETISINGLYKVIVELDEELSSSEEKAALAEVSHRLHANRNLCETFTDITTIDTQDFILCGEIGLSANANIEKTEARILFEVQNYLSPAIHSYSLKEMLAKGKKAEEIFEGPLYQDLDTLFSGGFIDDDELEQSALKSEIYLSDLIHLIMDIDGVVSVRDLLIKPNVASLPKNWDKWLVDIDEDMKAKLDTDLSKLVFYKDVLAFRSKKDVRDTELKKLNDELKASEESVHVSDFPMVNGEFVDPASYLSISKEFPLNYGISDLGLPSDASMAQKAQSKQLKAYLLFFDQLLANYFAQLSRVKDLFSTDPSIKHTYFTQLVDGMEDIESLFGDWITAADDLQAMIEGQELFYNRRNQFFDHLLARFNEQFTEYVLLTYSMSDQLAEKDEIIKDKSSFLQNYAWVSRNRSAGFNYTLADDLWNSYNVSGLQHRVAGLLGIQNYKRRDLARIQLNIYNEKDDDNIDEYRWRVVDSDNDKILLSSSTHYLDENDAIAEMEQSIEMGVVLENYELKETTDGRFYFNLVNTEKEVIARRIEYFETPEERDTAIKFVRRFLLQNYSSEGLFVIEHALLRPRVKGYPVFKTCDPKDSDCVVKDPYSYQISVVLPSWEPRFLNMDFRKFAEKTIRMETPAHILPKVCWINKIQMSELEDCYQDWLIANASYPKKATKYKESLARLLDILVSLDNVYPEGTLHDCVEGGDENPIILNLTSLGTLKNTKQSGSTTDT